MTFDEDGGKLRIGGTNAGLERFLGKMARNKLLPLSTARINEELYAMYPSY